ncbi:MAG: Mini-ribonuclease 3 [Clostridia bacterium]
METENEAESKIKLVKQMSPLTWAYLGDSIFETYIRDYLVDTTNLKPNKLHRKAIMYVKAKAQADVIKKLDAYLTDEEKDIVKRTRNTENHHVPKNADKADYMYSTAFEGLIGYLYLTKQEERLAEILKLSIEIHNNS